MEDINKPLKSAAVQFAEDEEVELSSEDFMETMKTMNQILPNIYLSGYRGSEDLEMLKQNNIKGILNVT